MISTLFVCVRVRNKTVRIEYRRAVAVKSVLIYVSHKWHLFIDFPDTVNITTTKTGKKCIYKNIEMNNK